MRPILTSHSGDSHRLADYQAAKLCSKYVKRLFAIQCRYQAPWPAVMAEFA